MPKNKFRSTSRIHGRDEKVINGGGKGRVQQDWDSGVQLETSPVFESEEIRSGTCTAHLLQEHIKTQSKHHVCCVSRLQ